MAGHKGEHPVIAAEKRVSKGRTRRKSNETAIAKSIRTALGAAGYHVFRVQSGMKKVDGYWMHFAPAGTPDIAGYTPDGTFLGIEVKDLAEPTPEQLSFLDNAASAGCLVGVAHNVKEAMDIASGRKEWVPGGDR